MKEMTREYVRQTLKEEHLWKVGEADTFTFKLTDVWAFTLTREEEQYAPFRYVLNGQKVGTNEIWDRRYKSMESAFLHIVNHLNENAGIQNKYKTIDEWLLEIK